MLDGLIQTSISLYLLGKGKHEVSTSFVCISFEEMISLKEYKLWNIFVNICKICHIVKMNVTYMLA